MHSFKYIFSIENLLFSFRKYKKGKSNNKDIIFFTRHLEDNIWSLHEAIVSDSYRHGAYKPFCISDSKKRNINVPIVKDRLVHYIIFEFLKNIFEPLFIRNSFASREEKGVDKMRKMIFGVSNKIYDYSGECFVGQMDIRKYFDSIDHLILIQKIKARVTCDKTLGIIRQIILSFNVLDGKGIPLGNVTSQIFANIYLNDVDWYAVKNFPNIFYSRYNDDLFFASRSRAKIVSAMNILVSKICIEPKLVIPKEKIKINKLSFGVPALGFIFYPKQILIKGITKQKMFLNVNDKNSSSYFGLLKQADSKELRDKLRSVLESETVV